MTDEQLLEQMSRGNSAAFETLIYRYHVQLHAYLYRMLGSVTMAEDATQECFLRLMESILKNRIPVAFKPWLYKVASNLCKDIWKKASYQKEWLNNDYATTIAAEETVPHIFEKQVEREMVIQALQKLDDERRNLIILRFYQELKFDDIAVILDLPLSIVKRKFYQTLKMLHQILEENVYEDRLEKVPTSNERRRSSEARRASK